MISEHRPSPDCPYRNATDPNAVGPCRGFLFEYDDGNGLWITSGESPFNQAFLGCICPQE